MEGRAGCFGCRINSIIMLNTRTYLRLCKPDSRLASACPLYFCWRLGEVICLERWHFPHRNTEAEINERINSHLQEGINTTINMLMSAGFLSARPSVKRERHQCFDSQCCTVVLALFMCAHVRHSQPGSTSWSPVGHTVVTIVTKLSRWGPMCVVYRPCEILV